MIIHPTPAVEYLEEDFEPMPEGDLQRRNLSYTTEALHHWFLSQENVYVSGNMFIYYEQGNNNASVAPDTFVVFGVSKNERRSYKVWEEGGKAPDFILEVTSKGTVTKDLEKNPAIYQRLGVREYFQYDPSGEYLEPFALKGDRLERGQYVAIATSFLPDGTLSLHSEVLGLDLHLYPDRGFRFFDPIAREALQTYEESQLARIAAEAIAKRERQRAEQERQEKERLAAYLRSLGINPDEI